MDHHPAQAHLKPRNTSHALILRVDQSFYKRDDQNPLNGHQNLYL